MNKITKKIKDKLKDYSTRKRLEFFEGKKKYPLLLVYS